MRKTGFAYITALLAACGGSDGVNLDGGSGDGSGNDVVTNDTGASDSAADTNPGNDSGGDAADSGGFNPALVPGLVLWLEADVSSSITTALNDAGVNKVTKWADQTSHHNDAVGFAQFSSADPTVKASAINSLPAMHFDQGTAASGSFGQELTIPDNADLSLQWGTGDFVVAIVGDFDNDPTKGSLGVGDFYSKTSFGNQPIGVIFLGNVPGSSQTTGLYFSTATTVGNFVTVSTAYNTGAPHLFELRRRGSTMDLFVDGTSVASTTGTNADISAAKMSTCIGSYGDPAFERLDGDIGEIMDVKGAISHADEAGLMAYLKAKWNTP
jgi:hypothetical protein